ncbi:inactive beta-amylase 9-like [Cynara cardunculus var. scolymus]|uniref:inactive beta-amylase 9-like n=1 Tax=Cynara cardunculus var. scolymus TaxID=59895 RepID=UPI000D62F083|nr:inactive beta-amylase 9-like [Cynara cardunculus var. scolymus]
MEMSLIGSSPAKFAISRRYLFQLSNNNNKNLMMICSSATKSQIGFGHIIRCPHLSLRVTAQSQSTIFTKASDRNTITNPKDGVKIYVGLPMDSVSDCNGINHSRAVAAGLKALKLLGVEGVELPIWWGVAEKEAMGKYEWSGYLTLVEMIQKVGLKLHVSLCFHGSKEENIPLPKWVSEIGESQPDIFFTDHSGQHYKDCLSFGVDDLPVFDGKTAMQVYEGFVESFKTSFSPFMGSTITGITIGMGPDGELRYSFSSPELLLADIRTACRNHGVEICGQNLNIGGTPKSFEQIKKNLAGGNGIDLFLYQRMGAEFFSPKNFPLFSGFVRSLNQLELDSDDLAVNEREAAVFVPGKNRKLQTV